MQGWLHLPRFWCEVEMCWQVGYSSQPAYVLATGALITSPRQNLPSLSHCSHRPSETFLVPALQWRICCEIGAIIYDNFPLTYCLYRSSLTSSDLYRHDTISLFVLLRVASRTGYSPKSNPATEFSNLTCISRRNLLISCVTLIKVFKLCT